MRIIKKKKKVPRKKKKKKSRQLSPSQLKIKTGGKCRNDCFIKNRTLLLRHSLTTLHLKLKGGLPVAVR